MAQSSGIRVVDQASGLGLRALEFRNLVCRFCSINFLRFGWVRARLIQRCYTSNLNPKAGKGPEKCRPLVAVLPENP